MGNEDFLIPIKKSNNNASQGIVNNEMSKEETGSIFNDSQVQANESNLVSIEDYELKEKGILSSVFSGILKGIKNYFKSEKNEIISVEDTTEIVKMADYNVLSKEDSKYTVNGEIDQDFSQGNVKDCVLLSSMYSLAQSEAGRAIIKDAIKINYDKNWNTESYDVYFKGLDKTYNISVEEYREAERLRLQYQRGEVDNYYSAGDDDVLLMELAYKAAFQDVLEAKSSSSIFAKTDALTSVDYEQFLYAFAGTEDINEEVFIRMDYRDIQAEKNSPKIREILETQEEFKLEDVYMSDVEISGRSINSFEFNWEDTYIVEQKPSENENNEIVIKNKSTGETVAIKYDFFVEALASNLTLEQEKQIGEDMYDLAVESDFVLFANASCNPIEVVDIDGNTHSIFQKHAYGVKEINDEYIILINPHDTTREIKILKDEYLKNYSEIEGFQLFSANFEE